MAGACQPLDLRAEGVGGERAAGEDGDPVGGVEAGDLCADHADAGFGFDGGANAAGKLDAIDGEGVAGWDGRLIGK